MPKSRGRDREVLIALGRVTRPHGVRGVVRVIPFNPETEAFSRLKKLRLRSPQSEEVREFEVQEAKQRRGLFFLKFDGVDSLAQASELRGWEIVALASELEPPDDDEYYYYELEGMAAYSESGELLGRVDGFISTAGHDICVIKGSGGEIMVPWVDDTVIDVDRENSRVVIDTGIGIVKNR